MLQIFKEIKSYGELIGTHKIIDVILTKKAGDTLPEYKVKSDICGWVIVSGDSPEEAWAKASERKPERIYHY